MTRRYYGGCAGSIVGLAIVIPFWIALILIYLGVAK